jgi:hypothetical protein
VAEEPGQTQDADGEQPTHTPGRWSLGCFGATVVLVGVALAAVGFFYFGGGSHFGGVGEPDDAPGTTARMATGFKSPAWLLLWGAAAWLLLALALGARGVTDPDRAVPRVHRRWTVRVTAAAIAVGGVLLVLREFPIPEFWLLRADVEPRNWGGFRDVPPVAGAAAIALGALALAVANPRRMWSQRPRTGAWWISAGGGVLAGALTAVLLAILAGAGVAHRAGPEVEHTTHDPADPPPALPASVDEVAWTWHPPDDLDAQEALPSAHGVIIRLGDGVLALDGRTGEEQWRYRRPGVPALMRISTDRETIALVYRTWTRHGTRTELLTFDAATGRSHDVHPTPDAYPEYAFRDVEVGYSGYSYSMDDVHLTPQTHVSLHREMEIGEVLVEGYDLHSGALVWSAPREAECVGPNDEYGELDRKRLQVVGDLVVFARRCDDSTEATNEVLALDADTGEERWRFAWEAEPGEYAPRIYSPPDYPDGPVAADSPGWVGAVRDHLVVERANEEGASLFSDGYVLKADTGEQVAGFDADPEHEDEQSRHLGVTEDAIVLEWWGEGHDGHTLEKVPFDGGDSVRIEEVGFRRSDHGGYTESRFAVLQDSVVWLGAGEFVEERDYKDFSVEVLDLQHDAAPRSVPLDAELNRVGNPYEVLLFPAPGALIAAPRTALHSSWMVIGLA